MATKVDGNVKEMDGEVYYPSDEVVAQATLKDWDATAARALKDQEAFWAAEAEELEWFQKWDEVLDDSNKPFFKWFVIHATIITPAQAPAARGVSSPSMSIEPAASSVTLASNA